MLRRMTKAIKDAKVVRVLSMRPVMSMQEALLIGVEECEIIDDYIHPPVKHSAACTVQEEGAHLSCMVKF